MHPFKEIYFEALEPNEPMIELMRDLRSRGHRMALLTNNVREWEPLWRSMLPVDEIFELVVDSAFVGMRKPEPPIYELTVERLGNGIGAAECLFVDDVLVNVEAARGARDDRASTSATTSRRSPRSRRRSAADGHHLGEPRAGWVPSRDVSVDFEVVIVGAGDVGAAIARELARFELRVALIDTGDVGAGTSKANTAILHTGFDAKPGTREAALVARGHALLLDYADQVGIPIERTGALLVAWDDEQLARLPAIADNASACGYQRMRRVSADELYRREPDLGPGAVGALEVPDEYVICPWTPPLAYATQAVLAGVELRRHEQVTDLHPPRLTLAGRDLARDVDRRMGDQCRRSAI